jgi:hypothetical protein
MRYNNAMNLDRMKLIMNYDSTKTLNENKISSLLKSNNSSNIVITDMMSPDNRYFVFLDEMYDLKENRKIGNFWDSIDNITLFLSHSFKHATFLPKQLREENLNTLSKLSLNESFNPNLGLLKEYTKEIVKKVQLTERTWSEWGGEKVGEFASWLGKNTTDLVTGTTQMVGAAGKGLYNLGGAIMSGDVVKVLELLGKGIYYFAHWLRTALYNPIGQILDAVLIATGIGKTVQWIPWAIIVALDIFEFMNPDQIPSEFKNEEEQNSPLWWRLMTIGFDVLGLVTAGVAAKAAKTQMSGLKSLIQKSPEEVALFLEQNPTMRTTVESMLKNVNKVPSFLQKAVDFLMKPFPKAAEWIKGILGQVSGFINNFTSGLSKIFSTKSAKVAGKELAINYGLEKGLEGAVDIGSKAYAKLKGGGEKLASVPPPSLSDEIGNVLKTTKLDYENTQLF